jgi:hypothetical protein
MDLETGTGNRGADIRAMAATGEEFWCSPDGKKHCCTDAAGLGGAGDAGRQDL